MRIGVIVENDQNRFFQANSLNVIVTFAYTHNYFL